MKEYNTKYGFFTTYDYTIFLKQERRDDNWVLWYSRPIACAVQSSFPNAPGDLAGRVSVRECFFYLQTEIWRDHWYADNGSNLWVSNKMAGNVDCQKYFENDLPDTQPGTGDEVEAPDTPPPPRTIRKESSADNEDDESGRCGKFPSCSQESWGEDLDRTPRIVQTKTCRW
jgi:hypothetical protein